jgi:hypothetical protein
MCRTICATVCCGAHQSRAWRVTPHQHGGFPRHPDQHPGTGVGAGVCRKSYKAQQIPAKATTESGPARNLLKLKQVFE